MELVQRLTENLEVSESERDAVNGEIVRLTTVLNEAKANYDRIVPQLVARHNYLQGQTDSLKEVIAGLKIEKAIDIVAGTETPEEKPSRPSKKPEKETNGA